MQPLQAQDVSAKSNTVTAIAYNSERQQVGVIAIRVH